MVAVANTAEGGTNGVTPDTSNTGGASGNAASTVTVGSGNTFTFDTAAAYKGTLGYNLTFGTTAGGQILWSCSTTIRTVFRFYFKTTTLPSATDYVATFRNSSANMAHMTITAANKFALQNAAGSAVSGSTATNAISANTWYRVEWAVTKGTTTSDGTLEYAYYVGDSTTAEFTYGPVSTLNTGTTNVSTIRIGRNTTGTVTGTHYYDDIAGQDLASGWIGPTASSQDETATVDYTGSGTLTTATNTLSMQAAPMFSGSGTLTSSVIPNPIVSPAFSGSGTLSSTRTLTASTSASFSGSGTLTSTVTNSFSSTANLSGSGTLTASATPAIPKTVAFSGSGTLTGSATSVGNVSVNLSGSGTLAPTNTSAGFNVSLPLTGSGTLGVTYTPTRYASPTLSGSGSLSTAVKPDAHVSLNASGVGTLSASLIAHASTQASFSGSGTFTIDVAQPEDIDVTGVLGSKRWASTLGSKRWEVLI